MVYLCIFFESCSKIGCRRGKVHRKVYEAARVESCFRLKAGLYPKEERKRQKNSGMRITKGYLWRETSMKAERIYSVCVCIRRTRPSLNIFCPWSYEEERVSHLFCQDILDLPFQVLEQLQETLGCANCEETSTNYQ